MPPHVRHRLLHDAERREVDRRRQLELDLGCAHLDAERIGALPVHPVADGGHEAPIVEDRRTKSVCDLPRLLHGGLDVALQFRRLFGEPGIDPRCPLGQRRCPEAEPREGRRQVVVQVAPEPPAFLLPREHEPRMRLAEFGERPSAVECGRRVHGEPFDDLAVTVGQRRLAPSRRHDQFRQLLAVEDDREPLDALRRDIAPDRDPDARVEDAAAAKLGCVEEERIDDRAHHRVGDLGRLGAIGQPFPQPRRRRRGIRPAPVHEERRQAKGEADDRVRERADGERSPPARRRGCGSGLHGDRRRGPVRDGKHRRRRQDGEHDAERGIHVPEPRPQQSDRRPDQDRHDGQVGQDLEHRAALADGRRAAESRGR